MELYEKINLHSHTYLCRHAEGTVEDYVKEALRNQMEVLGISDHTPLPIHREDGVRMALEEFPEYIEAIDEAQSKYPEIHLLKGIECDYLPKYEEFYRELKDTYHLDYLIGSVHFVRENGKIKSVFEEIMDRSRLKLYTEEMLGNLDCDLFTFVAHPDLFAMRLEQWDSYTEDCVREICKFAEQKHRILELNVNGQHRPGKPYPDERFWKIVADYDIETVINSDAHKIANLCAKKEVAYEIQQKYHLKQSGLFLEFMKNPLK